MRIRYLQGTFLTTPNYFCTIGNSGTMLTSPDGVTWTAAWATPPTTNNLWDVAYENNAVIAVGTAGTILSLHRIYPLAISTFPRTV